MDKTGDLTRELRQLQEQMGRLLELARRDAAGEPGGGWQPPVDIYEDGQRVVLEMELPGLEQHEIDVQVVEGALVVQGERRCSRAEDGALCQRSERSYGPFRRTFLLPAGVDAARIRASCERGVLTVVLPKQPAEPTRQIEVLVR